MKKIPAFLFGFVLAAALMSGCSSPTGGGDPPPAGDTAVSAPLDLSALVAMPVMGSLQNTTEIKNPRSKLRGIEDFSFKSLRMWGNKSPTPPVFRSKLRGIKP